MADQEHLDILKQGVKAWNQWRKEHADIRPDLRAANLKKAYLRGANLREADLNEADLREANLNEADLISADLGGANLNEADLISADLGGANLREADLISADLGGANLSGADLFRANLGDEAYLSRANLREANLSWVNLSGADLSEADLSEANLTRAILVNTNLRKANLTRCTIFGISVWNVDLEGASQDSLVITEMGESTITVDNLEVAQFIYLLLNNTKIREVIDTISKKAVLILGRFTPERKAVLDSIRDALRQRNYLPILFDFEKPSSRNFTETVRTLAHLSRFIIADLTDPNSIPQELYAIAPTLVVPIQPLLETSKREYSMFSDLSSTYHWILPIYRYTSLDNLLTSLQEQIIDPAEQKAKELEKR